MCHSQSHEIDQGPKLIWFDLSWTLDFHSGSLRWHNYRIPNYFAHCGSFFPLHVDMFMHCVGFSHYCNHHRRRIFCLNVTKTFNNQIVLSRQGENTVKRRLKHCFVWMARIMGVHACCSNTLWIFWIRDWRRNATHTHWRTRTLQHLSDEMWPVTSPHPTKFKTFQSQHKNIVKQSNTDLLRLLPLTPCQAGLVTAADRRMLRKDCKIAETIQLTPSTDLSATVSMRLAQSLHPTATSLPNHSPTTSGCSELIL